MREERMTDDREIGSWSDRKRGLVNCVCPRCNLFYSAMPVPHLCANCGYPEAVDRRDAYWENRKKEEQEALDLGAALGLCPPAQRTK